MPLPALGSGYQGGEGRGPGAWPAPTQTAQLGPPAPWGVPANGKINM